jgi:eukaryotic-like serine/threonine-protein kinase
MSGSNPVRQVCPAEIPRSSSAWSRISGYGILPPALAKGAVYRLGWLAVFYALSFPVFRLLHLLHMPATQFFPSPYFLADVAFVGAILTGIIVSALGFSTRLAPALVLDLGLIFQVLGGFWIALGDYGELPLAAVPFQGFSGLSIWIIFFTLVVPETLGKTLLAILATLLMGPLGLLIGTSYYERPIPAGTDWVVLFSPTLLVATFAVVLSRFIYNMGLEMQHVREMGSYKLVEKIGEGGMGEVWRAEHRFLTRPSAVKLLRSEVCGSQDSQSGTLLRRFEREVQATAALRSPHTIAIYDFGNSDEGCFYYVMELLEGFDLDAMVRRYGPLPAERVVHLLQQACDSLAEAHLAGLIHRDIKPRNLFICRLGLNYDFIKVLDFGLVKSLLLAGSSLDQLTLSGTTTGTPAYMAPEMALAHTDADGRADIYSLGCVAYWLLTGHLVFEGSGALPMLLAHVQEPPVPPSQRSELDIPPDVERVVLSCLEKSPDRRPQTAIDLSALLSECRVSKPWTANDAESWWRTHAPFLTGAVPSHPSAVKPA